MGKKRNLRERFDQFNHYIQDGGPEVDRVLYIVLLVLLIAFIVTTKGVVSDHKENAKQEQVEKDAKKALKKEKEEKAKQEEEAVSGGAVEAVDPTDENAPANTLDPTTGVNSSNPNGDTATGGRGPKDDFSDAVFLGDSRTEGLKLMGTLDKATFYTYKGLMASSAMTEKSIKLENGKKGTVLKALRQHTFGRVYLCFGLNELGWPNTDEWMKDYDKLIAKVKKIQPTAAIYIQNIMPVSQKRNNTDKIFNNRNVKKFNQLIAQICQNQNVTYVDLYSMIADKSGNLPKDASSDGIHLYGRYCEKWSEYLRGKGVQ